MITSGEVNKWGVDVAFHGETFLWFRALLLGQLWLCLSHACSVSQNDAGRMVTQHEPGDSETFLGVLEGGPGSEGVLLSG